MSIEILTAVLVVAAIVGSCIAFWDVARSKQTLADDLEKARALLQAAEERARAQANKFVDKRP